MSDINLHNVYDKELLSQEFKALNTVELIPNSNPVIPMDSELDKRITELENILTKFYNQLNARLDNEKEFDEYCSQSIDNLLLLVSFLQKNIVILQEYQFINGAKINVLESTPWYHKITVNQRRKLLKISEEKAKEKYASEKLKRFTEIEEIINNIQKRRKEK